MTDDPFFPIRIRGQKKVYPYCMSGETTEQAACRTLFNILIKVPTDRRLEAAAAALDIVEGHLGTDCPLYRSVKTLHVVCLVHQRVSTPRKAA